MYGWHDQGCNFDLEPALLYSLQTSILRGIYLIYEYKFRPSVLKEYRLNTDIPILKKDPISN